MPARRLLSLRPAHKLVIIIRTECIHIDTNTHFYLYCNGSVERTRCVCVWVSDWVEMRFVLRIQAWQCINDKILQGTKHAYTLPLSLERNENSYRTFDESVCAFSGIPTFFSLLSSCLSLSLSWLLLVAFLHGNNKRWRGGEERSTTHSVYYLVGWFFSRHRSLRTPSLLACCFFFSSLSLLLSNRFVDKRPRKGRGHPIGRKEASNFFLQVMVVVGGIFFVLHRRAAYNILFFHYCCLCLAFSLSRSLLLPVLVCKSSPCSAHARTRSKTRLTLLCD